MSELPQNPARGKRVLGKELDDELVKGLHALSNALHGVLEDHHAGPNTGLAAAVVARLMAQIIKERPAHVGRMERWRCVLRLLVAAEWLLEIGYQPSWLDSVFEAQHFFASGETGEIDLDAFLVELLHDGAGQARTRRRGLGGGLVCQS